MNNGEQKAFFQNCIYEALIRLMKEMPFDKISVTALCQEAGVSRITYYRSYYRLEDVLLQHLTQCADRYLATFEEDKQPSAEKILFNFFSFWNEEEQEFLKVIVEAGISSYLMNTFYDYFDNILELLHIEQDIPYMRSFAVGGLYKVLIDWVRNGFDASAQNMTELMLRGWDMVNFK